MSEHKASCSCGQLEITVTGAPRGVAMCHCIACQKRTGSTYGAQATYEPTNVTVAGVSTDCVRTFSSLPQS